MKRHFATRKEAQSAINNAKDLFIRGWQVFKKKKFQRNSKNKPFWIGTEFEFLNLD